MSELRHEALWPSHVFHRRNPAHDAIRGEIVRHAIELAETSSEAIASGIAPGSKQGLFESRFDLLDTPLEALTLLKRFCVETLVKVVERADRARLCHYRYTALDLVESWVHVTETGGYHDHHLHAFRDWCGIYYVEAGGEGSAVNRFYQPFLSMDGNRGHYDVTPEPGWLVVFPGHLAHAALPHRGVERRVVISFNACLVSGSDKPKASCDHLWGPEPAG